VPQHGATLVAVTVVTVQTERMQPRSAWKYGVTGRLGVRLLEFCRTRAFWLETVAR